VHSRDQDKAGYRFKSRARSVPTFVLVDQKGYEVDRLRGYPGGPGHFFPIVEAMLEKAPSSP
jgi:thioredoxin-related protein